MSVSKALQLLKGPGKFYRSVGGHRYGNCSSICKKSTTPTNLTLRLSKSGATGNMKPRGRMSLLINFKKVMIIYVLLF